MTGPKIRRFHLVIAVGDDSAEITNCVGEPTPEPDRERGTWIVQAEPEEQVIFTASASQASVVPALARVDDTVYQKPWTLLDSSALDSPRFQSQPFEDPHKGPKEKRPEDVPLPLAVIVPAASGKPKLCPTTIVFRPRLGE